MLLNLVGQADKTKIDEYESISHETRMRYIQEDGQAIEQVLRMSQKSGGNLDLDVKIPTLEKEKE
jgi:hypothetical protein